MNFKYCNSNYSWGMLSVAAKSQGQCKAETFLVSQEELAQLSSASAKFLALQCRRSLGSTGKRLRSTAATTCRDHGSTTSCPASRGCSQPNRHHGNSSRRCSTQTANTLSMYREGYLDALCKQPERWSTPIRLS